MQKPQINEVEKPLNREGPIYDRLYNLMKENEAKKKQEPEAKPKEKTSGKKNHRGKPIQEALSELHSIIESKKEE